MTLTGESGDLLLFNAGAAWDLNVIGAASASYVNAANSDASGGSTIDATDGTNTNSLGNTNWIFSLAKTWDGGGGDNNCSTSANWDGDTIPITTDDILLDGTSTKNMTWDAGCPATVASFSQNAGYTGTVTMATTYSGGFQTFTITNDLTINAGTWTHQDNSTAETNRLKVSVGGDLTVGASGTISADGLGYDANNGPGKGSSGHDSGGYGGVGGDNGGGPTGMTYGSITAPVNLGSGGNASSGGGAIYLTVTGTSTINGVITSDGLSTGTGGKGSGGSAYLTTGRISGSGTIRADGGDGVDGRSGGGGGRIAVVLTTSGADFSGFSGSMTTYGGDSTGTQDGAAGTIYKESEPQASGTGTLTIDDNDLTVARGVYTLMPVSVTVHDFSTITIQNKGHLAVDSDDTFNFGATTISGEGRDSAYITIVNATGVTFPNPYSIAGYTLVADGLSSVTGNWTITATGRLSHSDNSAAETYKINLTINGNLTVDAGGEINADGLGYDASTGPGASGGSGHFGSGHGGVGVNSAGSPSGVTYGSATAPVNMGSGGNASSGGGIVQLTVTGATAINGTISSDGLGTGTGGKGSGGSVYLMSGTISGSGTIRANGGNGVDGRGSGGGGRVAVILTGSGADFSGFLGTMAAYGGDGTGTEDGASGTVYKATQAQGTSGGMLVIDNSSLSTGSGVITDLNGTSSASVTVGSIVLSNGVKFQIGTDDTLATGGTGTTVTIGAGTTLTNTGALSIGGTGVSNSGTLTTSADTASVTFTGQADDSAVTIPVTTYDSLTVNNANTTFNLGGNITVEDTLTITSGTLAANGGNITLAGNWVNNGSFAPGTKTVTLNGANQSLSGSTNFYNLTKSGAGAAVTLTMANGATQTVAGTLTLQGASGQVLSLRSDSDGNAWLIDPQGLRVIGYLDVKDSRNINATAIDASAANTTDSGNNTGWVFGTTPAFTWTGLGADNNWSTGGNWQGGGAPASGNTAIFNATASKSVTIDTTVNVAGVTIASGYTGTITQGAGQTITVGAGGYSQSGGTFSGGNSAIDANGSFSLGGGAFTNTSGVLSVSGNFTLANGVTFNANSGTLKLDGDLTYTDNRGPQVSVGAVVIGSSPDTVELASDLVAVSLTINSGDVLNTNGYDLDIGGSVTINGVLNAADDVETDETMMNVAGSFTVNSGAALSADQSTLTMDGTSGVVAMVTDGAFSLYNLVINDGGASLTVEVEDALDVDGTLTITGGTLDAKSGENNTITVGGNWVNNDTFTTRGGTVIFDDNTKTSVISGNNTFYNLTSTTAGKAITLTAGSTQTVGNTLTLTGASGNRIVLRSTANNSKWDIDFTGGSQIVNFVDVKDSDANTNTVICINCNDAGNNNANWVFGDPNYTIIVPTDTRTTELTPTVYGTVTAGAAVELRNSLNALVAATTADAMGNYTVRLTSALGMGANTLTPFVGGVPGIPVTITVVAAPTTIQVPVITSPDEDSRISGNTPTIVGQGKPAEAVTIHAFDASGNFLFQPVGSGQVDGNGDFSVTVTTPLPKGAVSVVATVNGVASEIVDLQLTDPFGIVFDSVTNNPIEGATVTIFRSDGTQAVVGVDLDSGDSNPVTTGSNGFYSFLTADGNYYIEVNAQGYRYPSTKGSYPANRTIVTGSRGEEFTVAGVVLEMDHPMDANEMMLVVGKDANKTEAVVGEVVTYTVEVQNVSGNTALDVLLEDRIPAGFKYVDHRARLDGAAIIPTGERPIVFSIGDIGAGERKTLRYQLIVGSGVERGNYENVARAKLSDGSVVSNRAVETVRVVADAVFDLGNVIGKVYWFDSGQPTSNDPSLQGIKIITEQGFVITTDGYGRFSVPGLKPGRHVLRLDERTLPPGAELTTPKAVIVDARPGLPVKVNFGIRGARGQWVVDETGQAIEEPEESGIRVEHDQSQPVPRLNVGLMNEVLYVREDGLEVPAEFYIFTNYAAFIRSWELEITVGETSRRPRRKGKVIKRIRGDRWNIQDRIVWDGRDSKGELIKAEGRYLYRLRVKGRLTGEDETIEREIHVRRWMMDDKTDPSTDRVEWMAKESAVNNLRKQRIAIYGETVRVESGNNRDVDVMILRQGETYATVPMPPADGLRAKDMVGARRERRDGADIILPVGEYEVVAFKEEEGQMREYGKKAVKVGEDYLFFVLLGDAQVGYAMNQGNIEPVQSHDGYQEGFWSEGRLAYYLKGKVKGKYLVTSSFDSERDEKDIFNHLEEEKYYPVYGDDSGIDYGASDTQGRVYLMMEWDNNSAVWGNYQTALNDTELAQFNRSLYGGRMEVKSMGTSKDGEARTRAVVFGSQAPQRGAHNEFLGTGGSLFYLKHKDVVEGSERLQVEIRDKITGLVKEARPMRYNQDYEMDYKAGRILFYEPVEYIVDSGSIISEGLLNGDVVYVVVDYEYEVKDKLTEGTVGTRVEQALNDHLRIGGTYVRAGEISRDYQLAGMDVAVSGDLLDVRRWMLEAKDQGPDVSNIGHLTSNGMGQMPFTVRFEHAQSESRQITNFISTDGGLNFTELATAQDAQGDAYSLKGDVRLFNRMDASGYYQWIDADFSNSVSVAQQGKEVYGFGLDYDLGPNTLVSVNYDVQQLIDQGNAQSRMQVGAGETVVTNVRMIHQIRQLKLTGEYERHEVKAKNAMYESASNREGDTLALCGDYEVNKDLTVSVGQQFGSSNTQSAVGARYRLNDKTGVGVSETWGDGGSATGLSLSSQVNDRLDVTGEYMMGHSGDMNQVASLKAQAQVDESTAVTTRVSGSSDHSATVGVGAQKRINEDTKIEAKRDITQNKEQTTRTESFSLVKDYQGKIWEGTVGRKVGEGKGEASRSNIYGVSGDVNDWLRLQGQYEEGVVQHVSGEQSDRHALSLGAGMARKDPRSGETLIKSSSKVELRLDEGDNDVTQRVIYQELEGKVNEEVTLYAKGELSKSRNRTTAQTQERYTKVQMGGAYRPVRYDRWNILGSYTYKQEQGPAGQEDLTETQEERMHVLAGEWIYDLSDRWQLAEKIAYRMMDEKAADLDWTKSATWLQAHRLVYKLDERWRLAGEYRRLTQREAMDRKRGFLIEGIMQVDDFTQVGVGYNLTDFGDDLTDLDYRAHGPYVRVTGAFYDRSPQEIKKARERIKGGEAAKNMAQEGKGEEWKLFMKAERIYREGVELYKSKLYLPAKEKFEAVVGLDGDYRKVRKYLRYIEREVKKEEKRIKRAQARQVKEEAKKKAKQARDERRKQRQGEQSIPKEEK